MSESLKVLINGEEREVTVVERTRNIVRFQVAGRDYTVEFPASVPTDSTGGTARRSTGAAGTTGTPAPHTQNADGSLRVTAPIPGVICELAVSLGSKVERGELLLRLEAMKMQNGIYAPASGTITQIFVSEGKEVGDGEPLIDIQPA